MHDLRRFVDGSKKRRVPKNRRRDFTYEEKLNRKYIRPSKY